MGPLIILGHISCNGLGPIVVAYWMESISKNVTYGQLHDGFGQSAILKKFSRVENWLLLLLLMDFT